MKFKLDINLIVAGEDYKIYQLNNLDFPEYKELNLTPEEIKEELLEKSLFLYPKGSEVELVDSPKETYDTLLGYSKGVGLTPGIEKLIVESPEKLSKFIEEAKNNPEAQELGLLNFSLEDKFTIKLPLKHVSLI